MEALFLTVLNMSLKASYVILFVIVIRLFLKKIPKTYSYVLWFAVLFRLVCSFSFDSILSLIPDNVNIPQNIAYSPKPEINSGIRAIDSAVNNVLSPPLNPAASANPMQIWLGIGEAVWLIGIATLIIYSVYTTVKLYRNLRNAKHIENNIYTANGFKTPFVFGIVNPKIYLPNHLTESEKSYVLLHEQTHIKRLDHIVKLIFFIVTCIHWFNPLVWIAFYLMGEDMELSCDEKVVKQMGSSIKKEYSSSLLSMSTGRRILGGSPIAFGENNTEGRIKNILNYKKPSLWVLIVVSIIIIIFIVGLITNPKSNEAITSDRRPMIMVNGELYLDTGKEVSVEIDESAIIGEINSSVVQSEKPTENDQSNFGLIGAKYAHFDDNIVVRINNKWVIFEKEISGIKEADDATDPVEVVRADYMSWLKEDYTISMSVLNAEVDDAETQRQFEMYKGSELAESRGWTDEYLDQHFVVVKVRYECEFDHTKTFMNDGLLEGYVFLTRNLESGVWMIVDRTSPSEAS